ncbi:2-hydroxyacid dehydrogenase [Ningiella sp. W23]|uniref:2-hydroxyacid dehydrogenase n=1 Tax=Ningiella sp. W23 TaxID=3023715 RepID=UPI00375802AD
MKVGVFSCKPYDKDFFAAQNHHFGFELEFLECKLCPETVALAKPFDAVSVFVDDLIDKQVLDALKQYEVSHIALRCRGFSNVDIAYAKTLDISVSRVPYYSHTAVAEHAITLILALDRKLLRSYSRAIDNHYELEGLLGFNLKNRTVGVIGTGEIGKAFIRILNGFGSRVLCYDIAPDNQVDEAGNAYVDLDTLYKESDIISLHCPLTPDSEHMIDHNAIGLMKPNVMLINTSRGGLFNTQALIAGLKSKKIGYLGVDIYEMESEILEDSDGCESIPYDTYDRLATFENVLITSHQGFFTQESLEKVTETTLVNLQYFFAGKVCNETYL